MQLLYMYFCLIYMGGPRYQSLLVTARQPVRGSGPWLTFSHSVTLGSEGPHVFYMYISCIYMYYTCIIVDMQVLYM